ncbi:hypothetical protein [Celeribacter indicus]|uniref:hypothetical protein n=1 Tax=Celeribacter indicus TaxID=1208324 RepID=UPI001C314550|nr:hypothetical protein [Celeribacter indicus]
MCNQIAPAPLPSAMIMSTRAIAILTSREDVETWLTADWPEAKALQRVLDDDLLELIEKPAPEVR